MKRIKLNRRKKHILHIKKFFAAATIGALLAFIFTFHVTIKEIVQGFLKPTLEEERPASDFLPSPNPYEEPSGEVPSTLPESVNLDVPFMSQAPTGDWAQPYQDACEEAALIMAHYYLTGETLTPQLMKDEIIKMVEWENWTFGYYKDTNAAEMVRIAKEFYDYPEARVHRVNTIEDIKKHLAAGRPVVLPLAGRLLNNPHFASPGPVYHVITLKGYDDAQKKFISHDPGTRFGKDYLYDYDLIFNALHDWDPDQNILEGEKVVVTLW